MPRHIVTVAWPTRRKANLTRPLPIWPERHCICGIGVPLTACAAKRITGKKGKSHVNIKNLGKASLIAILVVAAGRVCRLPAGRRRGVVEVMEEAEADFMEAAGVDFMGEVGAGAEVDFVAAAEAGGAGAGCVPARSAPLHPLVDGAAGNSHTPATAWAIRPTVQ